jgi:50S ribosomal protein L16 3-hydroxylase
MIVSVWGILCRGKQEFEMDVNQAVQLLGGISPAAFMRRYWQKKPLLIRQAVAQFSPVLDRQQLFELAGRDGVESRLVLLKPESGKTSWRLRHGPFGRRALPALAQKNWTLLVQGVDLHVTAAHELMQEFRFVPDARLDDLMISYASDGGGVGPHFDSYDVFLLQAQGRRRWRIGRQRDLSPQDNAPLKILSHFVPQQEFVLESGDMLYLPPGYAHDGVALGGDCMTYSIGFRAPSKAELASELLQRLAQDVAETAGERLYRDPKQDAAACPAAIPVALEKFAHQALAQALKDSKAMPRLLGEYLTEPKSSVWFEAGPKSAIRTGLVLDRRTRMMYNQNHVFINGESYLASGADARLMRGLADQRRLSRQDMAGASQAAIVLLKSWCNNGWAYAN